MLSREGTINDLKQLMRELEDKKREIDSQYNAVAVTIRLLNGDSSEPIATTSQQPTVAPDTAGPDGDDEDSTVPW
jgi:hypothetical protein